MLLLHGRLIFSGTLLTLSYDNNSVHFFGSNLVSVTVKYGREYATCLSVIVLYVTFVQEYSPFSISYQQELS
jgi:hypothetical protein